MQFEELLVALATFSAGAVLKFLKLIIILNFKTLIELEKFYHVNEKGRGGCQLSVENRDYGYGIIGT